MKQYPRYNNRFNVSFIATLIVYKIFLDFEIFLTIQKCQNTIIDIIVIKAGKFKILKMLKWNFLYHQGHKNETGHQHHQTNLEVVV